MSTVTTLAALREPSAPTAAVPVQAGFFDLQSFELMQRVAKMFASSNIVPEAYRSVIEKLDRYGNVKEARENPRAMANCAVALSMAQRMNADPMMVMQNLHIIEGRPSWSSQWIIAAINSCGRFSPLHFDIEDRGPRDVEYVETYWENKERRTRTRKLAIDDKVCVAWATEKATGHRVESPPVSIEIAVREGWYGRNGSKWQTMPDMMLRYRSAAFFGKLYAPEILMGLGTAEEAHDIIEVSRQPDDSYAVTVESLRQPEPAPAIAQQPAPVESDPEPSSPDWPQTEPVTGRLIDARGVPWHEMAHSRSRVCNADGTWRKRRGVDPEWIEEFEAKHLAEFRALVASHANPPLAAPEPDAAPLPVDPATGETPAPTGMSDFEKIRIGIEQATARDEIDEWLDYSREVVISHSQRQTLAEVTSAALKRIAAAAGQGELLDA